MNHVHNPERQVSTMHATASPLIDSINCSTTPIQLKHKRMEITTRSGFLAALFLWSLLFQFHGILGEDFLSFVPLVTKESRRTIVSTESGTITAVDLYERYRRPYGPYHLQFITLDSSSLLLPVILHADMVFYVHSGRGTVNSITEDGMNRIEVKRGDIYRLEEGSIFYVHSHPDPAREKLRIHAIFNTILDENDSGIQGAFVGAYSNISDFIRGFDDEVLQMAFGVSEEVIEGIQAAEKSPSIVHFEPKNETDEVDWREGIFEALIGGRHAISIVNAKKKKEQKTKTLNLFERKADVENCNGWSVAVTSKEFKPFKGSNIGMFLVNLTKGSMMGPHWNPKATEIAIVTHGQGVVQVVCPGNPSGVSNEAPKCENTKFKVNEGDVFIVPRYHPMAQISFNNDSFVFVGFSTIAGQNHPQFLAGKRSVLRVLDRKILGVSFNTANTTIDKLLDSQVESVMFECTSCAEQMEREIEEEMERKKQEEARKREEEEARRREEEEKRKREQEEARRREEEERRKKEEEDQRKREEEEAKKREEEEEEEQRKREEEEEARKREEEEARKREEEEDRKREEEEARKREEEKARVREEEEQRKQEEEEARRREEEKQRREEEEEQRRSEEEEARRRGEEEEQRRREEEQEGRRGEEETRREEEEEEARRKEEEAKRREEEEEARRQEEEQEEAARRREEEEEEVRRQGEAKRREEEEEEARRREEEEEEGRRREEEDQRGHQEGR